MTDFLFIPSQSANGGRIRVRLIDIPQLFSEGVEAPEPSQPLVWRSLWQAFAASFTTTMKGVGLKLTAQLASLTPKRLPFEASDIESICAPMQRRQSQAQA